MTEGEAAGENANGPSAGWNPWGVGDYAGEGAAAGVAAPKLPGLHSTRLMQFQCINLRPCSRQGPGSAARSCAARAAGAGSTFCLRLWPCLLLLLARGSQPPRRGGHRPGACAGARQQRQRWRQRRRRRDACLPRPRPSPGCHLPQDRAPAACATAAACRAVAAALVQRGWRAAGGDRLQGAPALVARPAPPLLPGSGQPGRLRGCQGRLRQLCGWPGTKLAAARFYGLQSACLPVVDARADGLLD